MSTEDSNKDRGEADSMWLQKSITLPDPLPNCSGSTPPTKNNSPANPTGVEMDLTRSTADAASILASVQKPSMRYSTRMSVSNAAFSMHEMDDLRTKYSQAKRELLKVSDVQKDLDFARFELNRTQEELKMVQSTQRSLRDEVGEAEARADREAKARTALELRMHDEMGLKDKEIGFLKQQIDELRQDNSKRLNDITEQQEVEYQERIQMLRDDLLQATNDVEGLNAKLTDAETEKGALEEQLNAVKAERDAARSSTVDLHKKMESVLDQCKDLEKRHQDFVVQFEEDHEKQLQSQLTLNDERVKQLTASKDASITELREEIRGQKDRIRELGDELAVLRHRRDQQEDELKQLITDHAKELRNAAEEHRLALCERELMMDSAVREAKGSKVSLEEENLLLRRQATKAVEELNTVAAALVQREKQVAEMESTVRTVKESCAKYSRENEIIAQQAEVEREAADEAALRIQRLIEQKEELEMEFSKDLREAKDRIRSLEESLMLARREISDSNKERLQSDEGERVVVKDLRAQVEAISAERNQLRQRCSTLEAAQREAESFKRKYSMEKQKAETLNVELHAAIGRCSTLERKLEGEARRQITSANNSRERSNSAQPKLRTISSVNVLPRAAVVGGKRARTEDARVFAISGFDGNDLLSSIKKMPNVAIAECLSNLPVPSNLTHLITNGQLTIKLLTALVRGCWVLPESYVMDSLQERTWLPENNYGFQHEQPPLLKKHIAFSDAFMESKHYSTSTLLLKEGGAIISSMEEADIILCSGNEVDQLDGTGYTWEKMVDLIYPVKI